jgi:hypothetical protein
MWTLALLGSLKKTVQSPTPALHHRRGGPHTRRPAMDFNGDDRVGLLDLLAFAHRLGKDLEE